jgi:hypothetical protein
MKAPREAVTDAYRTYKFSDAVDAPTATADLEKGGKPLPDSAASAEQMRELHESSDAKDAEASNRERMIAIGRGNQQAGRQGQ